MSSSFSFSFSWEMSYWAMLLAVTNDLEILSNHSNEIGADGFERLEPIDWNQSMSSSIHPSILLILRSFKSAWLLLISRKSIVLMKSWNLLHSSFNDHHQSHGIIINYFYQRLLACFLEPELESKSVRFASSFYRQDAARRRCHLFLGHGTVRGSFSAKATFQVVSSGIGSGSSIWHQYPIESKK